MSPRNLIQGTPEWKQYKCGRLGASSLGDMLAKTKTGWGASRGNLKAKLVTERLTSAVRDGYSNDAMRKGIELEPQARSLYELLRGMDVEQIGWEDHPTIAWSGCSPDGLTPDGGLIEIKCPTEKTHMDTLFGGAIDGGYLKQMMWQMCCLNRAWCDFVSFCPAFPPEMQLHVTRVHRDDVMIANLELEATVFLKEVEDTVRALRERYQVLEAAE